MKPMSLSILICLLIVPGPAAALDVVSLAPGRGAPGTLVVVGGGPFAAGTQPFLGNHYVAPLRILEHRLEFTVPEIPPGDYLLTIQNESTVAESPFQFEVLAPTPDITELVPRNIDLCSTDSERLLEIDGRNFLAGAVAQVGDTVVPTRVVNATQLEARLPAFQQPGVYGVVVRNPDGEASLPHSLWVDGIPEISSVEQGEAFVDHYEMIVHGKNFLPNSILVVREPKGSTFGRNARQRSFIAGNGGADRGAAEVQPQRGRLTQVDCRTLVYDRYPTVFQTKTLELMVVNPDGHKTDTFYADLP